MIALNRNNLREEKEIEKAQQKLATNVLVRINKTSSLESKPDISF